MQNDIPDYPEQDETGGDALPTYDDLAARKGPNSRFGRWKSWVEKRAAERFVDLTPEERIRRRARGWGEGVSHAEEIAASTGNDNVLISEQRTLQPPPSVYSQGSYWSANALQLSSSNPPSYYTAQPETPIAPAGKPLLPSHLKTHQFGSRFLPHTTYPINALLPLLGDRLLLIGHDNGLSVLDMFPSGDPETSGPVDAQVRHIWEGEGVYQLELLEFQDTGDLTPHGVVLALVGSEVESPTNSKEQDVVRTIRMYNLSSLTSLARWSTSQKNAKPLDLRRPPHWIPQQTSKRHKRNSSSMNVFKSIIHDGQNELEGHTSQYSPSLSNRASVVPPRERHESGSSTESSWDVVDELPLRWATDFVPLASAGSRLSHANVLFFELWRGESSDIHGPSSLAIATKTCILLYETPKGERAFRFSKEFYTPLQPRGMSFVHQRSQETVVLRSPSESSQRSHKSLYSIDSDSSSRRFSSLRQSLDINQERQQPMSTGSSPDYGSQLSLFVVFDKKAGLIRLADASVGEVELNDDSPRDLFSPIGHSPRRSFIREHKGLWLPPTYEELPLLIYSNDVSTKPIYVLTRGKQTHIIPAPIPTPLSTCQPLYVLTWQHTPSQVRHRVCSPLDDPPFLQIIGFGEYGIEVQEIPLSVFTKGKGKGRVQEPVRAEIDFGGDVAFLYRGGRWHEPRRFLSRSDSFMTCSSASTVHPGGLRKSAEDGFYASCRKGLEDWRVFWLGGEEKDDYGSSDV